MWLKGSSQREACTQSSVTKVTEVSKVKRDQIMPFSKYKMPTHHLGSCQSSDSESPRWGLRFRIPDMIPGKANATGPWTTLGVARLSATDFILTTFRRL